MYFLLPGIFVFGADNPSENKSQTNRNSKKRFLPSLNKKRQKLCHAHIALVNRRFRELLKGWCADDIWCNWFPCLSAATHIGSYSFFHAEQCMIMSECFNKHRTPIQYQTPRLSGDYGIRILSQAVIASISILSRAVGFPGLAHDFVALLFYRIWVIILSTQ